MSFRDNEDGDYEEGESCGWHFGTLNVKGADPQMIVRDESGRIISVSTLDDGEIRLGELPESAFCQMDMEIRLPAGEYYTLYFAGLSEVRVFTFTSDDFPMEDWKRITVDPDWDEYADQHRLTAENPGDRVDGST